MLLHVGRDRDGRRRLTEISLLRRAAAGRVQAAPVWQIARGLTDHVSEFRVLLRDRMPQ
ncbi:conjugal transfer protein TrbB [[Mycobacterium] crassicus]|uniref:Conjugal transfer protein TrbB n=1 Tax=[Mycobacterium] crassicus TaxID=2872309 RepID=A0ABU5XIW4_9MYCO|nr:conjugal transfer protein TrbB [Mycolicibacter sp. MYC098]MEB3022230.1 conjugal transfer protein TrbB [Mycolicibacter sp. MYC098]